MIPVLAVNTSTVTLIAAILAAATALGGVPLGHWLQGRRERKQWIADRRLEAYAALGTTSFELASNTGILGGVLSHAPDFPLELVQQAQDNWTAAQSAFVAAQYRAVIVAGEELVTHIEKMSAAAFDMTGAMQDARPKIDTKSWRIVGPGDPQAIERLETLGEKASTLRNEFLRLSRGELGVASGHGSGTERRAKDATGESDQSDDAGDTTS